MRHAIFGAASLIGSHYMRRLIAAGEEVIGYDENPDAAGAMPIPIHKIDFERDLIEPERFFGIESIDVAYWMVKSPPFRQFPSRASHLFSVNSLGPVRAAEAIAAAGARCFIHVASASLYRPSWEPINEHGEFQHHNPYAISAIASEGFLNIFHAGKPRLGVACLRLFGLFGPGQRDGLVPGLIRRVKNGEGIALPPHPEDKQTDANGLQLSVTYVEDACDVIEALVRGHYERKLTDRFLNVASPQPTSIRALAEIIGRELHKVAHYEVPVEPRQGELIADVSRLAKYLEIPATPIDEALRRTVAAWVAA